MRYVMMLLCMMLVGCEKEPLQFFPQDQYLDISQEEKENDKNYYWHDETIVVISPPENNLGFIRAVDHYITEHYDLNEIYKYDYFTIGFLKESGDTKRVYQDWDEYVEYIEDPNNFGPTPRFNPEDILLLVAWSKIKPHQKKTQLVKQYSFRNERNRKGCSEIAIFYPVENEEEEILKQCQPSSESSD